MIIRLLSFYYLNSRTCVKNACHSSHVYQICKTIIKGTRRLSLSCRLSTLSLAMTMHCDVNLIQFLRQDLESKEVPFEAKASLVTFYLAVSYDHTS